MSSTIIAVQRRRTFLRASSFLVPILSLGISAAKAQQAASDQLPPIEVSPARDENQTRARPITDQGSGPARAAPNVVPGNSPYVSPASSPNNSVDAAGNRQFNGIVGASTTVITAQDIARSPAQTLPEIIAQVPGVQLQTLYGGVGGAQAMVDLRGFGAFATANSLLLVNGRRVNDIDLQGVDFSTIPIDSIERIEITRGNSGAVLYGDNAVGGVINIVTKTGAAGPPVSIRAEAGVGSFNRQLPSVSATTNKGPWSTSLFANGINSDGYRVNNALSQQNAVGEIRYTTSDFTAFFNVSGDNQHLGFPGGRMVNPSIGVNELVTARNGTDTPLDYGNQQGANATAGFTKTLWNGAELIVDGGMRNKDQQAAFFGNFPLLDFNASYDNTRLQTWSLTPRLSIKKPDVRIALGYSDRHRLLQCDLSFGAGRTGKHASHSHL